MVEAAGIPDETRRLEASWLASKPGKKWAATEEGELAAWVADMDFPPPPVVVEALIAELRFGDLGYPDRRDGTPLAEPFTEWMADRHGVRLDAGAVREFNNVVNAVQAALAVSLRPGDGVAFHTPTYPLFLTTFEQMGIRPEPIPLRAEEGTWRFDHGEAKAAIERASVLLLVNPHNPTGRVFTEDELRPLLEVARESGCVVLSDEVHADLVWGGARHIPSASVDPDVVTLFSATKSFNMAGIRCAVAHVGSPQVREQLGRRPDHLFGSVANLSVTATTAAWTLGGPWLERTRAVLEENRDTLAARLDPLLPGGAPEGTYLAWLDFSGTPLADDPAGLLRRHGVRLSEGTEFGSAGTGHARLNFATSPNVLEELLDRIVAALSGR